VPLERATATDIVAINAHQDVMSKAEVIDFARRHDVAVWEGRATIAKFHADDDVSRATPYEVIETEPNLLLTSGVTILWNLVTGAGGTAYNGTNARIAVGSSGAAGSGAAASGLTTESARQVVDSTPSVSTNTATFIATFGTGSANIAWAELGLTTASSGSTGFLNRLTGSWGTKTSSASWVATLTISIS
jgi:hypothetical protein